MFFKNAFFDRNNFRTFVGVIPTGSHELPFAFQIPEVGIISSYESPTLDFGIVQYSLKLTCPQVVETFDEKVIRVLQIIDVNSPEYKAPVRAKDSATAKICCFESGPLSVQIETDRSAYCSGEVVTLTATFSNKSRKPVQPFVKLFRREIHAAQGERIKMPTKPP